MYEFTDLSKFKFAARSRMPDMELGSTAEDMALVVAVLGPFAPYDLQKHRLTKPLYHSLMRQLFRARNHVRWQLALEGWDPRPLSTLCRPTPGYVMGTSRLRACTLPTWCPFCWARTTTSSVYKKLSRVLETRSAVRRKLVFSEWTKSFPESTPVEKILEFPIPTMRKSGVRLITVEPQADSWLLSCRTLRLPEDVKGLAGGLPAGLTDVSSRVKLARLTGKFCHYPSGWLVADPLRILELLLQRRSRRLLNSYGAFRHGAETRSRSLDRLVGAV